LAAEARVNGRWRLERLLGEGADATAWAAVDERDGRRVALKALKRLAGADARERLRWEFAALAALDHPNLLRVFDLEQAQAGGPLVAGQLFFTCERLDGRAPSESLARLPPKERARALCQLLAEVSSALDAIHRRGLLHHDVKPANLLVDGDGRARLADLGLAQARELGGGLRGTPAYLAPEAFEGAGDARVDLYALGATAFELWSGRPLRSGASVLELLREAGRPMPPLADLPTELAALIARLLEPDPRARPSSARRVLDEAVRLGARLDGALLRPPPRPLVSRPLHVGRDAELARALAALARPAETHVLVVEGAPGSGRSRFVEELRRAAQLAAAADDRAALAWHGPTIAAALRTLAADDALERGGDARTRLGVLCGRLARAPSVLHLDLGAGVGALERQLLALAASGAAAPSVVVVEAPLDEALPAGERVTLAPLDEAATVALCASMLGHAEPKLARAVHRASGGEPRRAVEIVRAAAARARDGAPPTAADVAALDTSDVGALVGRAIAALDEQARAAAEALAVIGRPATVDEVAAVVDGGHDANDRSARADAAATFLALRAAATAGVVEQGAREVRFPSRAHADAAYRAAPVRRRRALHERALATLGRAPFDRARHLAIVGTPAAAADAALEAGELAARAHDLELAESSLASAARLGRGAVEKRARLRLAEVRTERSDYRGALKALAPVERQRDPAFRAVARVAAARALQRAGEHRAAEERLRAVVSSPHVAPAIDAEARGLFGRVLLARGAWAEAAEVCAPRPGAPPSAVLDEARGLALLYLGRLDEADAAFAAVARAPEIGRSPTKLARACSLRGMAAQAREDLPRAAECYEEALRLARDACDLHGAAIYAHNLGGVLRDQAEYARALQPTEEAARDLGRLGKQLERSGALFSYGNLLLSIGDLDGAQAAAAEARALAEAEHAPQQLGYAHMLAGDLSRRRGRPGDAAAAYRRALDAFAGAGPNERGLAHLALAEAMAEAGDGAAAREELAALDPTANLVDTALARARVLLELDEPVAPELAAALDQAREQAARARRRELSFRADVALARVHIRAGDGARAAVHLDRAHATWEEIQMRTPELRRDSAAEDPDAERLRRLLAAASSSASSGAPAITGRAPAARAGDAHRRLLGINKRLNSELRLPRLLELILDTVIELTSAERGFILLADADGALHAEAARNIDQQAIAAGPDADASFSRSIAERAAREGAPIVTLDAAGDQRFEAALSVSHLKLRSVLAVPLQVKGKTVGCVYADHRLRAGAFDDGDVQLVCDLAEQAAIAIENARLLAENERRRREIASLNRELERKVASQAVELGELHKEVRSSRAALAVRYDYDNLVGRTPRMLELFRLLDRVTDTALPVVIYGESGTGKELVARAIHHNGPRRDRPFVSESCAAIPETLLEAALFGHVRGAFTGADSERRGLFEVASGGTLFLDEVGEMSPAMQTKLLRVLQSGEFRRVGGERTQHADVRVLVASNRDLQRLVDEGRFREDLFYRLNVVRVGLPPLRERRDDVPLLVEHFLRKHAEATGGKAKRIARAALARLVGYRWPGNVRELENEVMRAAALGGELIGVDDLSPHVAAGEPEASIDSPDDLTLHTRVERLERTLVREAMGRSGGNQSHAARLLGLSRFGLQKKLRRYHLE
jgi:transcriptional regulator with GAF, ATPase, and Fis domain